MRALPIADWRSHNGLLRAQCKFLRPVKFEKAIGNWKSAIGNKGEVAHGDTVQ